MKNKIKYGWVPLERKNSTDHLDLNRMRPVVFPNLKPSTIAISLRLTNSTLSELKAEANKRDVPYQSLMKIILGEWLSKHRGNPSKRPRTKIQNRQSSLKLKKK